MRAAANRVAAIRAQAILAAAVVVTALAGCGHLVILHDPLSAPEHNDLGVSYERQGEWRLAAREYRRALALDPGYARARLNLGNVAAHDGRWAAAEKLYRRAVRDMPADPDAWNNLAVALLRRGNRLAEAEGLAARAVALSGGRDSLYRATLMEVRAARLK